MDKHYIVIAGSGETSRANVEALVEDYVYANGNECIFILAYEKKPTAGQTYVSQWAKDKSKEVIVFANPDAKYDGISSATVNESDTPYKDAVTFLDKKDKAVGFILWNDSDPKSNEVVEVFNERLIKCFDLTDGLTTISLSPIEEEEVPNIPAAEMITEKVEVKEEYEDEVEEEDEDEEEESDELLDDVYFGLQSFIKAIAKEVVKELQKQEKPSKGARA